MTLMTDGQLSWITERKFSLLTLLHTIITIIGSLWEQRKHMICLFLVVVVVFNSGQKSLKGCRDLKNHMIWRISWPLFIPIWNPPLGFPGTILMYFLTPNFSTI